MAPLTLLGWGVVLTASEKAGLGKCWNKQSKILLSNEETSDSLYFAWRG